MPTPPLDEDSKKVTVNLFASDVEYLKKNSPSGLGWSGYLRELVHSMVKRMKERDHER